MLDLLLNSKQQSQAVLFGGGLMKDLTISCLIDSIGYIGEEGVVDSTPQDVLDQNCCTNKMMDTQAVAKQRRSSQGESQCV